jgi:hypothetical protein
MNGKRANPEQTKPLKYALTLAASRFGEIKLEDRFRKPPDVQQKRGTN